jgi:osmotically-inducible protein OsmY
MLIEEKVAVVGNVDLETDSKVSRIRERLEDHPHFRGRTQLLKIESIGGSVVVSGRVPTYYLKQLLQEAVRAIPGVAHIDNCVDVTYQ